MIIFLDKNYLDEAVLQKRQFLSQNLLTVPKHYDRIKPYPHRGKIEDDKYRFLWKTFKCDVTFLQVESSRQSADIENITVVAQDVFCHEPFDSKKCQNNSLTECITFNLGDDVIPNSNPGSPDLFSSDEYVTEDNPGSFFHEIYEKENLQLFSVSNDSLKMETCLSRSEETDIPSNQVPSLSNLKSRLTAMVPTDPFVHKDGHVISEKLVFRASLLYSTDKQETADMQNDLGLHSFQDKIEKQPILNNQVEKYLEEVITDTIELEAKEEVYRRLSQSLGTNSKVLKQIPVNEDESVLQEVINKILKEEKDNSVTMVPYIGQVSNDEEITFLDINEPIVTEIDRLCEDALLDMPISLHQESLPDLEFPKCEPLDQTSTKRNFLDQKKKSCLNKMCFSSELYCNAIQAFRLAEPCNLETDTELRVPEMHIEQVKKLTKLEKQTTASLDLQLLWDVAKISDIGKDPTYTFAKLQIDKSELMVSDITEVVTKASVEDFIDPNEDMVFKNDNQNEEIRKEEVPKTSIENITEIQDNSVNQVECEFNDDFSAKFSAVSKLRFDPLGEFMALRSKKDKAVSRKVTGHLSTHKIDDRVVPVKVSTEDNKPSSEKLENSSNKLKQEKGLSVRQLAAKCKKTKHHLVTVRLSDAYQELISVIDKAASTYLSLLKSSNDITRSCSFNTLSPDITRFLVKQREKYHSENNVDAREDSTYRNIVCAHALVGTAEILVNCCLESSLTFLSAIQDRYKPIIQNSLETIHQRLLQSGALCSQKQIYHPKMMALCREIELWLKKKRAKSGDNEQKILIIVRKNIPTLMNNLKKVLNLSKLLQPKITLTAESDALIESLDVHNCIILHTNLIKDTFPWAQFCLVVEYEYQENLEWKDHCERQNIRHMSLKIEQNWEQDKNVEKDWYSEQNEKQITLIASQQVTGFSTLLQLLESRYNIQVYERDYSLLDKCKGLSFSDVDIDENTAIILENLTTLREDKTLHHLLNHIIAVSLKYTVCYCLFYTKDKTVSTGYQFPGHVIGNLCKLQTAMLNFESRSKTSFKTKILICPDVCELAVMIRRISEETPTSKTGGCTENWLDRSWLTSEFTQEERLLLQYPCISSFNAQLMLKTVGMSGIVRSCKDDLFDAVPGISRTTLSMFHESLHRHHQNLTQKAIPHFTNEVRNNHSTTLDKDHEMLPNKETVSSGSIYINPDEPKDVIPSETNMITAYRKKDLPIAKCDGHPKQEPFPLRHDPKAIYGSDKAYGINSEHTTSDTPRSSSKSSYQGDTGMKVMMQCQKSSRVLGRTEMQDQNKCPNNTLEFRQTPVRRQLEFNKRNLTKAEQSFRECFGAKHTDKIKAPLKVELPHYKTDNVFNEAALRDVDNVCTIYNEGNNDHLYQHHRSELDRNNQFRNITDSEHMVSIATIANDEALSPNDLYRPNNVPSVAVIKHDQGHAKQALDNDNTNCTKSPYRQFTPHSDGTDAALKNVGDFQKASSDVYRIPSLYQNIIGQPVQTFDYNHGLSQNDVDNNRQNICQDTQKTVQRRNLQEHILALMREFPPSHEVDRMKITECTNIDTNYNRIHNSQSPTILNIELPLDSRTNSQNNNQIKYFNNHFSDQGLETSLFNGSLVSQDTATDKENKIQVGFMNTVQSSAKRDNSHIMQDQNQYMQQENVKRYKELHTSFMNNVQSSAKKENRHIMQDPSQFIQDVKRYKELDTPMETDKENKFKVRFMNTVQSLAKRDDSHIMQDQNQYIQDENINRFKDTPMKNNTQFNVRDQNEMYLNPGMNRVSLRPDCVSSMDGDANRGMQTDKYTKRTNFEDDIRESTRRFLQNSEELPRFESNSRRYPMQERRIGLAQPLQRRVQSDENHHQRDDVQVPVWPHEEKMKLVQSPWATADSPPMDIDYDDSQANMTSDLYQNFNERTNRFVFSEQTPQKKRKLSYQKIPGKRGQTKLIFQ